MARIKPEVKQIVGKRISGLVIKESTSRTRPPLHQLFLLFDDGTYYEFFTHDCEIGTTGGVSRGTLDDVLSYMSDTRIPIIIEEEDKDLSHDSCRSLNISDMADNETRKLYGEPPKNPAQAGFLVLLLLGFGVPLCLSIIDALAYLLGYELLARHAQVNPIFLTLGVVAGVGVYLYQNRIRHKWFVCNIEIYQRLQNEHTKQDT